tara:strand:+ start:144 stop:686 length:543 start_codon:yes stop_codon:yes gene_type:complete
MSVFLFGSGGSSDMKLIFSTTLTSPASTFNFNPLPTDYTSLRIDSKIRVDGTGVGGGLLVYFNGDLTEGNYVGRRQFLRAGYVTDTPTWGGARFVGAGTANGSPAGHFAGSTTIIHNYRGTASYKTWTMSAAVFQNNNTNQHFMQCHSGMWKNTSAITSMTLTSGPDMLVGSFIAVYGLK